LIISIPSTSWVSMAHGDEVAFSSTFQRLGPSLKWRDPLTCCEPKEFFLLLSSTGLAFRRCELAWIDGTHVGVRFISMVKKKVRASTSEMNGAERPQP
jgi:hypothetical protein